MLSLHEQEVVRVAARGTVSSMTMHRPPQLPQETCDGESGRAASRQPLAWCRGAAVASAGSGLPVAGTLLTGAGPWRTGPWAGSSWEGVQVGLPSCPGGVACEDSGWSGSWLDSCTACRVGREGFAWCTTKARGKDARAEGKSSSADIAVLQHNINETDLVIRRMGRGKPVQARHRYSRQYSGFTLKTNLWITRTPNFLCFQMQSIGDMLSLKYDERNVP